MPTFDALVIGGGPAGATAAALLARAGWSVALAEKARFPRDKVCGGYVGPATWPVFERLGLAGHFERMGGPEVRTVGLFAGEERLTADMPAARAPCRPFGRAIVRREFDALVLERAAELGALVYQPCTVAAIEAAGQTPLFRCGLELAHAVRLEIEAGIVIAAHGSWVPGPLPTEMPRRGARPSDLLGFKAHFRGSALPAHTMPLVALRGGYGGLVNTAHGRTTFSFCVRRERLEAARAAEPGLGAGDALFRAIMRECAGVRDALHGAVREGAWLSAGPIRPGMRALRREGIFVLGNAAGEAHPAVAEGIGMAMQSAALLCDALAGAPGAASRVYGRRWRARFAPRIAVSAVIAHAAMRPGAIRACASLIRRAPRLLSCFARLSGKTRFG